MRLAIQNDLIKKAYIINYMDKVYKIKEVKDTSPVTYIVVDDQGIQQNAKSVDHLYRDHCTDIPFTEFKKLITNHHHHKYLG